MVLNRSGRGVSWLPNRVRLLFQARRGEKSPVSYAKIDRLRLIISYLNIDNAFLSAIVAAVVPGGLR